MSILINSQTRLLVQGITGDAARFHTKLMREYGTNIVAGVRPGAGGTEVDGIKVFNTVQDVMEGKHPNASILFVPAKVMKGAAFEAFEAGIKTIVMVSEHIPLHDTMEIVTKAQLVGARIIGPNTPGLISPAEKCKVGFVPSSYYIPGKVGVASRSGTLTYEIVSRLTEAGIGQSTCVGIGGDPVIGTPFSEIVQLFQNDPATGAILMIGEIGGTMEEEAAELVQKGEITKPVVAYLAGRTAPPDKKMGHAGAIIAGGRGTIESKLDAFERARIPVAKVPGEVVGLVQEVFS
ncbi:succinate--CoA ligase subunit alpha [candidate division KSB1 bacterium]|nr:succinate--CoA ligase subunit alpha [candidate division KSB1 bacterium]MBL7095543.1 succinate--CoA ligase subunit alpha [candidate division KSB1 bacterium]